MIPGIVAGQMVSSGGGSGDPYWDDVQMLLNFDSDYADSGPDGYTITTSAHALRDPAIKKFGANSLGCDDYSRYDVVTAASAPNFLADDYTIEMWLYVSSRESEGLLWRCSYAHSVSISTSGVLSVYADNYYFPGGTLAHQNTVPTGEWVHIAVSKISGYTKCFINGVASTTSLYETEFYGAVAGSIISIPSCMRIDEYRITAGVGRYLATFTPPSDAFPTS